MTATLLLPVTLLVMSFACGIQIIRDVALGHYGRATAGLLWGAIFIAATMISAPPLLSLLNSVI